MQDVIGAGSSARMNLPGRERGNWSFRFTWDQAPGNLSARFAEMVDLYDRRLPVQQNTATVVPEQGAPTRAVEPEPPAG
jgi:4-alpha-glucanotransferase